MANVSAAKKERIKFEAEEFQIRQELEYQLFITDLAITLGLKEEVVERIVDNVI